MEIKPIAVANGGRKSSHAVVNLLEGKGKVVVNNRTLEEYFPDPFIQENLRKPLSVSAATEKYDVVIRVRGGGKTGQAEAARLALSRALIKTDNQLGPSLRAEGLLTRDPRMKERKKYGRKSARRGFQWTKR